MTNQIKCPYCDELIDSSVEKCPYCAEIIENNENINSIGSNNIEANPNEQIANSFKNHLEFLGYEVNQDSNTENNNIFLYSTHESKPNLTLIIIRNDVIIIKSQYSIEENEANKLLDIYKIINEINTNSIITKWYYSKDDSELYNINIEGFINKYEKQYFIKYFEIMENEITSNITKFLNIEE